MMMAAVLNIQRYDWQTWLMGIMRSTIQGGAAAIVGAIGTMSIDPKDFNLADGMSHTLKLMAIMFVLQGLTHMMMFLQTHGTPDLVVDSTLDPPPAMLNTVKPPISLGPKPPAPPALQG